MKKLLLLLFFIAAAGVAYTQCNTAAPKIITLSFSGGEVWRPNDAGTFYNIKGGDTVRVPAGTYNLLELGNFSGDACRPVVITNYGGQVIIKQIRFGNDARYFKIVGTGTAGITYGFKVQPSSGIGVAIGLAHHVEVSNIEVINPSDLGFFFKINPDNADARTLYNNYRMTKFNIHHNYLHNIGGEGMYIGHSAPNGDGTTGKLIPIRMDSVEIAYNIVDGTDWDGIQLANGRYGCNIHHNKVSNYGRLKVWSQQGGILMGSNTSGDIHHNIITNGSGNGIQVFGMGTINVYSNQIENAGVDGTTSGQHSVYSNDYTSTVETNPKQQIFFTNNIIRYPKPIGAVKLSTDNNNSLPQSITGNKLCITNPPANWQSTYLKADANNSTVVNNTLDCLATLPIKFISFHARRENKNIRVEFEVAEDVNVKNYFIQISTDGKTYRNVKLVDGKLSANKKYSILIYD